MLKLTFLGQSGHDMVTTAWISVVSGMVGHFVEAVLLVQCLWSEVLVSICRETLCQQTIHLKIGLNLVVITLHGRTTSPHLSLSAPDAKDC